ncbi:MAG: cellulase family glycosylhydrolase [Spirochaetales bacterium]|nr:cellulase family glycosylhydrolase [Spirochaetales bacterium]
MNNITMKQKRKPIFIMILIAFLLASSTVLFAQMRNITGYELVDDMKLGWNLGNSFDSLGGDETAWGNPVTTRELIDMIAARGFKTVRIPVSWGEHVGPGPSYTIDTARLDRVQAVVDYCLADGMYAIVNMHHENEWLIPTYAAETASTAEMKKIWTQIANRFKSYNDYLIFETMNEPRVEGSAAEWSGGTEENRDVINHFNQAALDAIRATGGNNSSRWVMITTHAATSMDVAIEALVIPNDSHILVSQHTYYPYSFCLDSGGTSAWGSEKEKTDMDIELDRINNFWRAKGIAVVIGEWGSIDKNNTAARAAHAEYYAGGVRNRGMLGIWWDNGWTGSEGLAILDRDTLTWHRPQIAEALIIGVTLPVSSPFPGYDCSPFPEWDPATVYADAGTKVKYNCRLYENKWYTENQNPEEYSDSNEVWTNIGPCECAISPTQVPADTPSPTPNPTSDPTPTPATTQAGVMGDVNNSGEIDIVDALLTAQYYVGLDPQNFDMSRADVNCDGSIDIVDALLIAQYYVGLITQFC